MTRRPPRVERHVVAKRGQRRIAVSLRRALSDPMLLGGALSGDSWATWRALLLGAVGEALTDAERAIFQKVTGRAHEPNFPVSELTVIAGRRGGKSYAVSALLCWLAGLCDHRDKLARGEVGVCLAISRDQRVARIILGYVEGILQASPVLRRLIVNRTQDTIELSNRINIEVRPASYKTLRGPTYVCVVGDEVSFWDTAVDFANPDVEILAACRPALLTTSGPLLLVSSAYAQSGVMYTSYKRDYGPNGSPEYLVAWGSSRDFNPSLPQSEIDRELARDPVRNRAEYLSEFRVDVEGYIARETVEACVGDHQELLPRDDVRYHCFLDAASGTDGGDSYAIAVSHREGNQVVIDCCREARPPFSPARIVDDVLVPLCKAYRIERAVGDNYAGNFCKEPVFKAGIYYELAKEHKSELYRDALLPLLNSRQIVLPRIDRLINQTCQLERSVKRSGRDEITHPTHGHDDLVNAVAGAACLAQRMIEQHIPMTPGVMVSSGPRYIPGSDGPRIGGLYDEPIRDNRSATERWASWYYNGGGNRWPW
jgi:hypothetical protein